MAVGWERILLRDGILAVCVVPEWPVDSVCIGELDALLLLGDDLTKLPTWVF